ncbi:MAG: hypothetical protein DI535_23140 [Citrobacter freundii]|nr:MAG: hypothetical protein DI535_23140 [Citrobacter freundii]
MFSFLPPRFRRRKWVLLGVCLFCYFLGSSQQAELQKIAPLSPNAASLLRYTETDIGHFTGSANISFPLHTVKSGSLSLNLSLGYNSTGNKVEDIASWVGLGWNLTTIPVVTRTVRGLPDEDYPGISVPYMGKKIHEIIEISNTPSHPSGLTGDIICQIANGQLDTEPDYFHYTLADGRSGYFYWDPYLEKYQTTPYRNFAITKVGAGSIDAIQIIDDIGNIYLFADRETSQSSGTFNSPVTRNAWYVSTITNSNKTDAINFGYGTYSVITRTLNPMRRELNGYCPDNSSLISTTTVQTKIPSMISSAEGSVTFVGADDFREDLNGSYALKSLEVRDNDNNLIKKINLHYEYTSAVSYDPLCAMVSSFTYEQKRLFLKSFAEMSLTGTDSVMHSFQYNNTIVAPCRVSAAQDFWGYYNAQHSNQNLIPEIPKGAVLLPQAAPGANRFVNPSVNQFGILNRIYLPTGGYTDIEYETHQVLDVNKEFPAVYLEKNAYLLPEHEISSNTFIDTISIYSDRDYFINNDNAGGSFVNIVLGDKECVSDPPPAVNCAQLFIRGIDSWNSDINIPVVNNMSLYYLKKGRYELKAMFAQTPVSEQGFFMYLKWREVDTTYKHAYIGGLRVKSIKTTDNGGNTYTKKYQYTNGLDSDTSSGSPISGSAFFRVQHANCPDVVASYIVADNSVMQTSHGGSFVGYKNVIELRDSLAEQGYTQYQFDYLRDEVSNSTPFVPAWDNSEFRGHLINTKIFAKAASGFRLLREERNQYSNYLMDSLAYTAMKTFKVLNGPACELSGGESGVLYWNEPYPYAPRTSFLRNKRTIEFNQYNADSIVTNLELIYNMKNMQVSRQISTSSKGEGLDQFIYYAVDSASSGNATAVWDTLIKRNMIAIPLKQVSQTNGAPTSTFISKYAQAAGSGYMQVRELWQGYLTHTPEAKVFYNYSSADKLSEQQKANDVKEVYLWGYNGQYPVAKILNSTYAVASSYITPSVLNSPTSDAALRSHLNNLRSIPGAMVFTYTYKSGVGITSETDANGRTTYYEYDDHNRLSLVRDHDNNIVKKICYNYAGQPGACGVE